MKKLDRDEKQEQGVPEFTASDSIQCLSEATIWNEQTVKEMNLKDKDIFIVIGASRTGKGTLLSAMMGQTMKFMKAKQNNIE